MMRKKLLTAAAAAMALVTAPVAAQAALAERTPAAIGKSESLDSGVLLALVGAAVVAVGIIIVADDDSPTSP